MNSTNKVRRNKLREKQYGLSFGYSAWICSFPCAACKRAPGWTIPAHAARTRGAGGTWRDVIPLCFLCENAFHTMGLNSFEQKYGINCTKVAAEMVRRWEGENPEGVTGTSWEDSGGG